MRLNQLKKRWAYMSQAEKIDLIERTNKRRIESFEVRIKKATKKKSKKSSSSSKKTRSRTPKTPQGLLELMKKMTPEERKNFELMIKTKQT